MDVNKYTSMNTDEKRAFCRENPIEGDILIKIPKLPEFYMYSRNEDTVVKELYWTEFKGWENTSLEIWNYFAESDNGLVLDIGSYSGIYSLIAAFNKKNKVLAFDIQKECIEKINKNITLNKFSNIKCHQFGFADKNEVLQFHFNESSDVMTSVASLIKSKNHNSVAEVMVRKGDDLLSELAKGEAVKLIKIDVEGVEQSVIKGMQKTIERDKPNMLIEINKRLQVNDVIKLLPSDYKCYQIDESEPQMKEFGLLSIIKKQLGRNYLFTTKLPEKLNHLVN